MTKLTALGCLLAVTACGARAADPVHDAAGVADAGGAGAGGGGAGSAGSSGGGAGGTGGGGPAGTGDASTADAAADQADDGADRPTTDAGGDDAPEAGSGPTLVWPNDQSRANSDPWLVQHHSEVAQLRPRVLLLNFANRFDASMTKVLADKHIAAWREASRPHGYADPAATPFVDYQIAKIVDLRDGGAATNSAKLPVSGGGVDYGALNTPAFAALMGIDDPDAPGTKLNLCGLFEKGLINEVWGMVADPAPAKFAESAETKLAYDGSDARVSGRAVCVSNGPCIDRVLPCKVSTRIYDFNPTRGAGCHLHAAGHAWENYIRRDAMPSLQKAASRFLNVDFERRFAARFASFYEACGGASITTDCVKWSDQVHARSGPSASQSFDFPDMSGGCGNAHFYPNTVGNYSYERATSDADDPTVLASCEHYGLHDGPGGKDLTTPYTNRMTFGLYDGNPNVDRDCGGRGNTYIYQSYPSRGTAARNDDGTPMKSWWVYLYY